MHNTLRYDRKRQMSDAEAQLLVNEVFSGYSALLGDHAALLDFTFGTQLVEWRQVKFAIAIRCKSKPQEDSPRWLELLYLNEDNLMFDP